MPYIKVDINKLNQYLQTMENVRAITGSATGDFCAIANRIDPKLRQMSDIDGQLRSIEEALYRHQRVQANMSGFLDFAQQKYRLLSNHDSVGDADISKGVAYAIANVTVNLQTEGAIMVSPSPDEGRNMQIRHEVLKKQIEEKFNTVVTKAAVAAAVTAGAADDNINTAIAGATAVAAAVTAGAADRKIDTAIAGATAVAAAVTAGTADENINTAFAGAATVIAGVTASAADEKIDAAVAKAAAVAAGVTTGAMAEEAELLRSVAATLDVKVEDLLDDMEKGAYTLKDITECIEGKATDANKFLQKATDFLKNQTGTTDLVFEERNGHWILSGYHRDSKANELVMKYHDGTGIGSRYNEDTLINTPVLGTVFQADQLAKKAEEVTQKVQETADFIQKSADTVLVAVDIADKYRERGKEAADKIADVLADENTTKDEKLATSIAIADTTIVSTTMDVAAAPAGHAVNSVVSKFIGDKAGDDTLGKEVGNMAEKLVTGGMNIISGVVASDAVVNQVAQKNLEIGNAIKASEKTIGEAGKKLLESDSVGEAILNVGNLVVTVGGAQSNIVNTVVKENAKVVYTVAKEATMIAVDQVGDAVVAGVETVYNKAKTEYETIKGFKEDIVGGVNTLAVLAYETHSVMKSSDKDIAFSEAVALAAQELGISQADIHDSINKGLCTAQDIFEYLEGKATESNAFIKNFSSKLRTIAGATDMVFKNKDGYIIVSEFTRKGWTNTLVKKFNDGTGIGTRYKPETLKDTPVIGTLYKADEAVKVMDKAVQVVDAVVTGVTGVIETGQKINDIWNDETLTKKEKIYDTAAVAITGVVGTALDVAAPFAGTAVRTAVAGAISAVPVVGPVVGYAVGAVAGAIVEGGMRLVSDVITSEAVVNQVSDSMMKVGDTVAAEGKVVSEAGKKILESENAKEAIANTAEFVGTALKSGAKVVATAVTEGAKVAVTVAQETAKAVGEAVVSKAKAVGETAKKVVDGAKKAAAAVGDAVSAGAKVVSDAAKEAAEKAAKALEAAKEEAKRKAEELARAAAEKARQAAERAAEEIKRKAEEAKRQAEEAKRKLEEAARKAAEEARKKAEEIARKAAEAKRKAEEAARKAAEEAKRKAEEIARKAAEAKRKAEEAARRAAEEAKRKAAEIARKAAEAKRKAEEAARKAAEAARKKAEEAKRKAAEAARKAAEAAKKAAEKAKKALSKW